MIMGKIEVAYNVNILQCNAHCTIFSSMKYNTFHHFVQNEAEKDLSKGPFVNI